jgi:hypothetical protein
MMKKILPTAMIYAVLFLSSSARAVDYIECTYAQKTGQKTVTEIKCVSYSKCKEDPACKGDAVISNNVIADAAYNEEGLAYLYSAAGIFCFNEKGLARRVLTFDNGPDYFQEGLARTEQKGKIGFINKKLSIVVGPEYDFAFPFKNGVSVVCNGCTRKLTGEHVEVEGGRWGAINTKGKIVQPVMHSKSELQAKFK